MSAAKKRKKNKNKKKNYNNNINNKSNNISNAVKEINNIEEQNLSENESTSNEEIVVNNEAEAEINSIQDISNEENTITENENYIRNLEEVEAIEKGTNIDNKDEKLFTDSNADKISNENVKENKRLLDREKLKEIHNRVRQRIKNRHDMIRRNVIIRKKKRSEKPEYAEKMLKNKKRKNQIIGTLILVFVFAIVISTGFALYNINNPNIISGVKVNEIYLSKLSLEDAKKLLTEVTEKELMPEIHLKYNDDYAVEIKPEEIEFKYDVDKAIAEAYEVGRNDNIFINNYSIILAGLFDKKIELEYSYNESLLNDFIDDLNSELPGVVIEPSYYIEEKNLYISKGKDGIEVDREVLRNSIIDGIKSRKIEDITSDGFEQVLSVPVKNAKAKEIDVEKIHTEIFKEPQDAYFTKDPYQIFVDVDGVDFNISIEEAKKIIEQENKEEYTIPLKISKAAKTVQDLGKEAFPYKISFFSTKYDASNINRSTNLAIAAGKINGRVLMPGEVFSFNSVVGKRTIEEGYKDAKIYADGGVVDGLAGGICQISSTLYNAALLANLEIVERKNHSYPASYISVGKDATVVYGVKDLQFKNSRSYPIKIEGSVKNGVAEFEIYGIQEPEEYEIKILPVTTGTIPYGTEYIHDGSLAPGQQVVMQSGHMGYRVTTYIEKRLNGELVSKDILSNDTYSPMQTKIRVGPAAPAPAIPDPAAVPGIPTP